MEKEELGRKIKNARIQKGMTQESLAKKCNLDIRTIQRIEAGIVVPRFHTIQIINDMLHTKFNVNDGSLFEKEIYRFRKIFNSLTTKDDLFPILMVNSCIWALVIIVLLVVLNGTGYYTKIYPILASGAVISIVAVSKAWTIRKRKLNID